MHGDLNVIQIFTRWTSVATKSQNEYEKLDLPGFFKHTKCQLQVSHRGTELQLYEC